MGRRLLELGAAVATRAPGEEKDEGPRIAIVTAVDESFCSVRDADPTSTLSWQAPWGDVWLLTNRKKFRKGDEVYSLWRENQYTPWTTEFYAAFVTSTKARKGHTRLKFHTEAIQRDIPDFIDLDPSYGGHTVRAVIKVQDTADRRLEEILQSVRAAAAAAEQAKQAAVAEQGVGANHTGPAGAGAGAGARATAGGDMQNGTGLSVTSMGGVQLAPFSESTRKRVRSPKAEAELSTTDTSEPQQKRPKIDSTSPATATAPAQPLPSPSASSDDPAEEPARLVVQLHKDGKFVMPEVQADLKALEEELLPHISRINLQPDREHTDDESYVAGSGHRVGWDEVQELPACDLTIAPYALRW